MEFFKTVVAGSAFGVFFSVFLREVFPQVWYLAKFPVCFLHEVCHFLVALVLGGRPSLPSFAVRFEGKKVVLGSVRCSRVTVFNAFPIGTAPLLAWLIPVCLYKTGTHPLWVFAASAYLSPESFPSGQDLKTTLSSGSALLWIPLLLLSWTLLSPLLICF